MKELVGLILMLSCTQAIASTVCEKRVSANADVGFQEDLATGRYTIRILKNGLYKGAGIYKIDQCKKDSSGSTVCALQKTADYTSRKQLPQSLMFNKNKANEFLLSGLGASNILFSKTDCHESQPIFPGDIAGDRTVCRNEPGKGYVCSPLYCTYDPARGESCIPTTCTYDPVKGDICKPDTRRCYYDPARGDVCE